jgi:hypothetical protein
VPGVAHGNARNAISPCLADRLAAAHAAGALPDLDFEAVAVLAIGPVVDFKIKQHLLGFTPLDLDEERFVRAWTHLFGTLFGFVA